LSPGHGKRGSMSLYRGLGQSLQQGPGGGSPSEAESSVAFEAPAEEPTLVTDSFCSLYRETLMFISQKFGGDKSVVFGAEFAAWGGLAQEAPLSSPLD